MNEKSKQSDQAFQPQTSRSETSLEIDTRDLLGKRREVTIIHAGERYRLRVTSNNKLILTK
ncbi:MAG: hemin uptake protein HemP [Alphaproteobacteria bacterium]|nr:hemin uptake protein HemP [Alphaproteobacteria bacterium]MBM3639882.1 hemin uptake protein HemP [Alphaproteobacteria bacterium]